MPDRKTDFIGKYVIALTIDRLPIRRKLGWCKSTATNSVFLLSRLNVARRSPGISKMITALMLLVFLAPQHVCLPCLAACYPAPRCESLTCDCASDLDLPTREPIEETPRQHPCDHSKCPHCSAKSLCAAITQPIEVYPLFTNILIVAIELSHDVHSQRVSLSHALQRPPDGNHHSYHPRI